MDTTSDDDIEHQIAGDPDTAPELTDEELNQAEVWEGDRFVRRVGRPKGSGKKELVTLRIDRDLLAALRGSGPGWQTRANDFLRAAIAERHEAGAVIATHVARTIEALQHARRRLAELKLPVDEIEKIIIEAERSAQTAYGAARWLAEFHGTDFNEQVLSRLGDDEERVREIARRTGDKAADEARRMIEQKRREDIA